MNVSFDSSLFEDDLSEHTKVINQLIRGCTEVPNKDGRSVGVVSPSHTVVEETAKTTGIEQSPQPTPVVWTRAYVIGNSVTGIEEPRVEQPDQIPRPQSQWPQKKEIIFQCLDCKAAGMNTIFRTASDLSHHQKLAHVLNTPAIACLLSECGQTFLSESERNMHYASEHAPKLFNK